jgi:DNA-binding NarL/FixJ family response regulator
MYLSPRVAGVLVSRARGGASAVQVGTSRVQSLTPREREVFQLLALGKSNKEVAKALGMSLGTSKKHRENLQRKLECHSAAELALLAIKEGMLSA